MLFSKIFSTRLCSVSKRYYSTPEPIGDYLVSPHNSYVIPKRGFRPAMKYPIYDSSQHPSLKDLQGYSESSLVKSAAYLLPRPFDKMNYDAACRYVEWSYPYTGLDIENHISNINKLVGETSLPRTIKLIDVYKTRYNIEERLVYDKTDLFKLIKPSTTTMKAISNKKKRVYSYFMSKNKMEITMELQNRKQNLGPDSKVSFSTVAAEMYNALSEEKMNEYKRAVDEDWENIKEIFQYDEAKQAWKSRESYSLKKSGY